VRIAAVLLLTIAVTGCNRGARNNEAVRQGVMDHLTKAGLNVKGMDVSMTALQFNGDRADATVSIVPKGVPGGGMSMMYRLERQNGNWVVVGRQDAGAPHGAGAMTPGIPNPHGGVMPPSAAAPGGVSPGGMPAPEDLPPAGKKK
jgi:hypothetical protein